ncbi:hypothetical protein GJ496_011918 [Pomphorhynchus laevis]|nr:hypothetical protein GJ496_011918 [Pomphorhynchus laevis]
MEVRNSKTITMSMHPLPSASTSINNYQLPTKQYHFEHHLNELEQSTQPSKSSIGILLKGDIFPDLSPWTTSDWLKSPRSVKRHCHSRRSPRYRTQPVTLHEISEVDESQFDNSGKELASNYNAVYDQDDERKICLANKILPCFDRNQSQFGYSSSTTVSDHHR